MYGEKPLYFFVKQLNFVQYCLHPTRCFVGTDNSKESSIFAYNVHTNLHTHTHIYIYIVGRVAQSV